MGETSDLSWLLRSQRFHTSCSGKLSTSISNVRLYRMGFEEEGREGRIYCIPRHAYYYLGAR
jgi:hypothetical protein